MTTLKDLGRSISRFVDERRKRRQLEFELDTLGAMGCLDGALADAGLVRSQIGPLIADSGRSRATLDRMLDRLGLDADRFDTGNLRDMTWKCTTCADKPQCRTWLDSGATLGFEMFCPNSAELGRAQRATAATGKAADAAAGTDVDWAAAGGSSDGAYWPTADERKQMRAARHRRQVRALLDGPF